MPLTSEEQRLINDIKSHTVSHDTEAVELVMRLVAIIERLTPPVWNVGDRVMAIDYKGERLGKGRVIASQRHHGEYMKVHLDTGMEVTVPQAMAKRLVKVKK
jgi:hypothetical protein